MTIKECIDIVDTQKPNQYTVKDKVMWLSFLDELIINDVLKTHEGYDGRYDTFTGYSEDKLSVTLIAPSPYDRVYTAYLKMRIDGENGETARYNNSMVLYNSYLTEYKKYYNKTHMPIDVTAKRKAEKPKTTSAGLTDAELEGLTKELTYIFTEYFSDAVSPEKIDEAVQKYLSNNAERFKGKDGYTPIKGQDYWTDADKAEITAYIDGTGKELLSASKAYTDKAEQNAKAYTNGKIEESKAYMLAENEKVLAAAKAYADGVTDKPSIPKECDITDNAIWSYELCVNPASTEGMRSFSYIEGNLNFDIEIDSSASGFVGKTVVFFNPKTGDVLVCYCMGYLFYEWGYEYNFINLENPLDVTNLEDFKKKYTHCGIYSGKYKWKKDNAKAYTDTAIQQAILDSWEVGV